MEQQQPLKEIIAAGGLVFNQHNQLLMIFRRGWWDLPKGKLDDGESIEDCALREVMEETGIKHLTIQSFINTTQHQYFDQWIKEEVIKTTHWYKMLTSDSNTTPQTEEDITQIAWVDNNKIDEFLKQTYPNIIQIIKQCKW